MLQAAHILRKYEPLQWGGTETAVLRLVQGLQQHGVKSRIHAPWQQSQISNLRSQISDPLATASLGVRRYHSFVPVAGISDHQRDELISWGGNLFSFDLLWHLLRERCQVVHAHALNRLAGIGHVAARLRKVPFVITLHGGALDVPKAVHDQLTQPLKGGFEWGKALGWMVQSRRVLANADAIMTCNPREAELLQAKYPHQRIVVQPHSVPADAYAVDHRAAAQAAFPSIAGRELLVKVARLDPAKNLPWLVREMPAILARHPKAMLALVGAGTTQSVVDELHREIARLGLDQHVLLTGGLPAGSPELIGLIQQAKAFVLASTAEPFGIVILEAWAAGTPVISSRTSGACSLITHGDTGLLYDLGQPAEFHAAIDAVLTNPALHATLASQGRRRAIADFDIPAVAGRVSRLYAELYEHKQSHRRPASLS